MSLDYKCGYIALVGRPNVGKSTLLNRLLGQKLSITSRKPQTTRHRILGIKTQDNVQCIYVDTPGMHRGGGRKINHFMNKAALGALKDVDLICFVVDSIHFNEGDDWAFKQVKKADKPVILVINKIDSVENKDDLLPQINQLSEGFEFKAIVPVSAKHGQNIPALESEIIQQLPDSSFFYFPEAMLSDRDDFFRISEIIREKLMRQLGQELPYEVHVQIVRLIKEEKIVHMDCNLIVAREGQKAIVVGAGGERLKKIGTAARLDLEEFFHQKVMLKLWVKVKDRWADNEVDLKRWGYDK